MSCTRFKSLNHKGSDCIDLEKLAAAAEFSIVEAADCKSAEVGRE